MKIVGSDKTVRLTHTQQLEKVRSFFQHIDPNHWGSGRIVSHEDFDKAEGQRRRHENNLRHQVRLRLR